MGTAAQPPFWNRAILKGFYSIMAARRVTSTAIDWVKFADKIPAAQQPAFQAFKNKHGEYLKAVNALPEAPPKIDFAGYANKIAVAGLVEEFQKKYESLEIPYPKESLSVTFDQLGAQKKVEYEKFVKASKANIEAHKVDMAKLEAHITITSGLWILNTLLIPSSVTKCVLLFKKFWLLKVLSGNIMTGNLVRVKTMARILLAKDMCLVYEKPFKNLFSPSIE